MNSSSQTTSVHTEHSSLFCPQYLMVPYSELAAACLPEHRCGGRRYGFIVMDGNGSLFGTLSGNTRDILGKFTVELPKKHGRGGQSALRFARLRMEKRHNYVRKVRSLALL